MGEMEDKQAKRNLVPHDPVKTKIISIGQKIKLKMEYNTEKILKTSDMKFPAKFEIIV